MPAPAAPPITYTCAELVDDGGACGTLYDGPHASQYLRTYAADGSTDHGSLGAAQAACTADPTCGGITLETKGAYTTRLGASGLAPSGGAQASWVKGHKAICWNCCASSGYCGYDINEDGFYCGAANGNPAS